MKSILQPQSITLALIALAALAAIFGHLPPEALAAAGMVPLALGTTSLEGVTELLEEQSRVIEQFKARHITRVDTLEQEVNALLRKANRPNIGGGLDGNDSERMSAFLGYCRSGRETVELKSMEAGSDPQGGYLVPPELDRQLTKNLREMSPMRQLANVVAVSAAELKQVHSRGGTTYSWVGETSSRPETTAPSLKQITIPTREVYAMPGITQSLLDDNVFGLENWLIEELSQAFGDAEGDAFINGDGVACPRGLFTYTAVSTADATRSHDEFQYIPTGASGNFHTDQADPLIKLVFAVKPAYRKNASWLMSSEVLEAVRKFKTATTNEYIWQPGLTAGEPSTLLGYPVFEDPNIPAIAANSLSVAFGDFQRAYTITDRSTAMLRDPYTQKPYVMFYAARRVGGGGGRDTRAVKFLKFSAT